MEFEPDDHGRHRRHRQKHLELSHGLVTLFATESSFPLTRSFNEKQIAMDEDMSDIQSTANSSEMMTLTELGRFIDRNKEAGLDTVRYEVDYQAKFGFACAALVMSMVGIRSASGAPARAGRSSTSAFAWLWPSATGFYTVRVSR